MFFQRRFEVKKHYQDTTAYPKFSDAKTIGGDLQRAFLNGEYDEVYLAHNQFINPLSQKMVFEKILPIDPQALSSDELADKKADYLFEPPVDKLLEHLIPNFLYFRIYFALLENSAGEHGARMTSMDNATKNATELISHYSLLRNRARQAQITIELTEIVGGAEALNN